MQTQSIDIVKSTVPLLEANGRAITDAFYTRLFAHNPELKHIFNMANQGKGEQSQALSDAVLAYARNIDNLEVLLPVVRRIAHKHASLGIQAEHYPIVGESLLAAIQEVLSLPDDHAALAAWAEAYGKLADVFIDTESQIYRDNQRQLGGWQGFRTFLIDKIEDETSEVKSFYLQPQDGGELPRFAAGQYVGVRVRPRDSEYDEVRQYSLSHHERFRISVKAERAGVVSNYLHQCHEGDAIELQAPTGVFSLRENQEKHVFIAGGVGITPLMGMMQEALAKGVREQDILFIQCAQEEHHQIFKRDLSELTSTYHVRHRLCYEYSDQGDHQGYLNPDIILNWLQDGGFSSSNAQVYFCGPKPFMSAMNDCFLSLGFDECDIHYEVFGPTTKL